MRRPSLQRFERYWARELFATILPEYLHPQVPESARELGAEEALDQIYRHTSWLGAIGIRLTVAALWFGPLLVIGTPRTFGGLAVAKREEYLHAVYWHRLYAVRQLVLMLKVYASVGYFCHPKTRKAFRLCEKDAVDMPLPDPTIVEQAS